VPARAARPPHRADGRRGDPEVPSGGDADLEIHPADHLPASAQIAEPAAMLKAAADGRPIPNPVDPRRGY